MARNKFGFPTKKKKTMIAKGYAGGGKMSADPDAPENTYLANVKERAENLVRTPIVAIGRALTPERATVPLKLREQKQIADINAIDEPVEKPDGMRRGGKVKAKIKIRGVGCAQRGHGKGKMV